MTGAGLPLRPYQIEAVKAVEAAHSRGLRCPAVVLPTGTGKTVVIGELVKRRHERVTQIRIGRRVLAVAHRTEIVDQIVNKIHDAAPWLRVGVVQGQRNETRADVVVASVQTLASESRRRMIDDVGLIIVDECHHAVAETYLRMLAHYGAWGGGAPVGQQAHAVAVGFTATMMRSDDKSLGDVWQDVVYSRSISEMIQTGYLVRPQGIRVRVDDLDLRTVRTSRGDFQEGDLGRAITESMAPQAIAKAIVEHAPDECGLIFAPTVASAKVVEESVAGTGMSTAFVSGATPASERRDIWRRFLRGDTQWVANCGVATEGTDLPRATTAVIARPTKSQGLYIQMAGRVLRPFPGKMRALLLDVVGVTEIHALHSGLSLFGEEAAGIREKQEREDAEPDDDGTMTAAKALGLDDRVIDGEYRDGPLVSEEVDLFHSSTSMWLRTYGGTWFLQAGQRYIALIPGIEPDTWDVATMDAARPGTGRWLINGVHDLSYAMAWAEGDVTASERMTAAREQSWRNRKPTDVQRNIARSWGLALDSKMSKGEVASLLLVAAASQRIDPYTPIYARGR